MTNSSTGTNSSGLCATASEPGPDHDALRADRAEMHEVAGALESRAGRERARRGGGTRRGSPHDRLVGRGLGRAAGRLADTRRSRRDAEARRAPSAAGLDLGLHRVLVFARHHAAVEQKVAPVRHDVVGDAAVDAGDGQARGADQRVPAPAHDARVVLLDEADQLGRAKDRVVAEIRRARMGGDAVHPDQRAQAALVGDDGAVRGRLADDGEIDRGRLGGVVPGAGARRPPRRRRRRRAACRVQRGRGRAASMRTASSIAASGPLQSQAPRP